jgi:hypothetical protein
MIKKLSFLLIAISLFSGCSTNTEQADEPHSSAANTNEEKEPNKEATTVTGSASKTPPKNDKGDIKNKPDISKDSAEKMTPSISYKQDGETIYFTFKVKNNLDQMFTYHFDTSQQFDYSIKDMDGKIVRNYSEDEKSTKLPGISQVKPGGAITFEVPVEDLAPGSYIINFVLTAKEIQPKTSLEFVVE